MREKHIARKSRNHIETVQFLGHAWIVTYKRAVLRNWNRTTVYGLRGAEDGPYSRTVLRDVPMHTLLRLKDAPADSVRLEEFI